MDGATSIIFDKSGKKILMVKRRDIPAWVLPGGGLEKGETPLQGAIREVKEETGYDVKIVKQIGEYFLQRTKTTNYLFLAKIVSGRPRLSPESKAIEFFSPNSLPEIRALLTDEFIADLQKNSKKVIKRAVYGITNKQLLRMLPKHPEYIIRLFLIRLGIHLNT